MHRFDLLRTQETLGYIVHVGLSLRWGVCGLTFIIQADKASPRYLSHFDFLQNCICCGLSMKSFY